MKKLIKLHELLMVLANDQVEESKMCEAHKLIYAMAYADGKEQGYKHAAKLLQAIIEDELPWEE